ncbi:MAG: hypothetical protein BWX88_01705 [Planctomycetes bacterium ADurb.Bin126]|nr:MAG: hypothetical protein BWX88_01705 [Planctomycetes bacterium ADurb.Bin126]HQL73176.1 hypothetical protein [Phycisphaerae bacterium]
MKKSGMTLGQVMVVLGCLILLALLGAALLPDLGRARELSKRAMCGANLNGLGKALSNYAAANRGSFPWAVDASTYSFSNTTPMRLGGYDRIYRAGKEDPDTPIPGPCLFMSEDGRDNLHILENLCLLVEMGHLGWNAFRCPSVGSWVMPRWEFGNRKCGFYGRASASDPGTYFIDYAMHWGYDNNKAGQPNKAPIIPDKSPPDLAVLADRHGRSMREFKRVDSASDNDGTGWNHGDEGVNVLTLSCNVFWLDKVASGWGGNNIYLRDLKADDTLDPAATTQGIPLSKYDSVLVNPEPFKP